MERFAKIANGIFVNTQSYMFDWVLKTPLYITGLSFLLGYIKRYITKS